MTALTAVRAVALDGSVWWVPAAAVATVTARATWNVSPDAATVARWRAIGLDVSHLDTRAS